MRTLQPILFGTKKGNREDPGVYGIFSVALKRKGTLGMSPFLPSSRKNDSLCFLVASPSGFEPLLTA